MKKTDYDVIIIGAGAAGEAILLECRSNSG
ncbi:pyruvate/2-oxoglutarate dehydrogenase complex dihydrolipoamide dehydrogenase (E3) component [Paenibacillus harenae]|uniref:Pyruvate/2-oxoglutarate dehydrogenase complex dihydrolipoamide dehydrogenase (E3) component n=1 Tax=Paenibacillus harenae TaxID=306543 RepID=A0ABT9UAD4_PAEHA|nr:pyruvate/2-oxoglutarate dehydrogenase complex dihydrolipoamide dehydrogenase (E3) component [Paenibacillus harenae]